MYPILFQYKALSIGSYGVMLGLGFYFGFLLFERELKFRGKDPELAYKILLAAIPCGIIGSKVFHILEHIDEFLADPSGMIISGAGLSVYGGFLMALAVSYFIVRRSGESFIEIGDIVAPSLALGYCFGRFGCHASGDGCYGIETLSFLGTAYPNGIVPTSMPVIPTPLLEVFFSFIVVAIMLHMRRKDLATGVVFFTYLLLNGIPRFLVEFIRLNPRFFGLSQAQWIAIGLIAVSVAGIWFSYTRNKTKKA